MTTLTLTEIWIYPVKSLRGIRLTKSKVLDKGLPNDRRWMLVDNKGVFMTQRIYPQLALFTPSIDHDRMTITKRRDAAGPASITFSIDMPPLGEILQTKVWDDEVSVTEVDTKISQWFSEQVGTICRLVKFPEQNARPVNPRYKVNDEHVSLADAYPFLIIGQSSLDDLNRRMKEPLPMNRFRPNFVFTGGEPFIEDTFQHFSIGKNRFAGVKPCDRCVLTTVNQDTGEKGVEPLVTLSTYRKRENKIYFGQNLVALDHEEVSVGDPIVVN
jgi:uncharacterized protein